MVSIGLIYGTSNPERDAERETFLAFAATQIKANARLFEEIEEHLIAAYQAVPCQSERELRILKINVIANCFPEVLDLPAPLPENATEEQRLEYASRVTGFEAFDQAENYPAEKLGLLMRVYTIPNGKPKGAIICMEMKTHYMSLSNAPKEVSDELRVWQGVSQEDIDHKSPRFVAYADALRDLGRLRPPK